jgi:hypothetical protein
MVKICSVVVGQTATYSEHVAIPKMPVLRSRVPVARE